MKKREGMKEKSEIPQVWAVPGQSKAVGSFCPTLMTSETSGDDVTLVDSSFAATGRVRELREVRSSLVVQTIHPILIDYEDKKKRLMGK